MSSNIHPKLKTEYNSLKFMSFLFPILGGIFFIVALFFFISNHNDDDSLVLLIISFVVFLLFSGLPFLFRKNVQTIEEASTILFNHTPVKKTLNSTNILSFKGSIYYLTDLNTSDENNKTFISLFTSKNKVPKKPPIEVNAYFSETKSNKAILVDDGKNLFTGNLIDKTQARELLYKSIRFSPIIYTIVSIIIIILLIIVGLEINDRKIFEQHVIDSFKWNSVKGEVTSTGIQLVKIKRDKNTLDGYNAIVEYEYKVNNKTYKANTISLDYTASTDFAYTKQIINSYPINDSAEIFYNPHNPNESYLIKANLSAIQSRNHTMFITLIIVVFIFIVINIFAIYLVRKSIKKQKMLLEKL